MYDENVIPRLSLTMALVALVALFAPAAASAGKYDRYLASERQCHGADDATASARSQERTMRCLINYARAKKHLRKLKANKQLSRSATLKGRSIDRCGKFTHTPCGEEFSGSFQQARYTAHGGGWSIGENLAWMAPRDQATPRKIMRMWLYSPGHRHNVFRSKWREQGVQLHRAKQFMGYDNAVIWVSQFGVRY